MKAITLQNIGFIQIDEALQVDVATDASAPSCARNVAIAGEA